ncbi:MAG TPA: GNAT family N-acetyltransferase [Thermoplasmata archaeon]|nr:GNAT family N-acetyltransferase [Thermoplasmata archaeon]
MSETARIPDGVEIRRAPGPEWERYRDLRLRALELDPLAFGSTLERERAFGPSEWKERLDRSGSSTWVAVDPSGSFVGMVVVADVEGALHLFAMWVAPERRRQGIGRRLLDAALAWVALEHPSRPVVLEVNPRQVVAARLYGSRGFRPTGRTADLGHTPGERLVEWARPPEARTDPGATDRPKRPSGP